MHMSRLSKQKNIFGARTTTTERGCGHYITRCICQDFRNKKIFLVQEPQQRNGDVDTTSPERLREGVWSQQDDDQRKYSHIRHDG